MRGIASLIQYSRFIVLAILFCTLYACRKWQRASEAVAAVELTCQLCIDCHHTNCFTRTDFIET